MSAALGTTDKCATVGCNRRRMTTAQGRADGPIKYARCEFCTARFLSGAFGPELGSRGVVGALRVSRSLPGVETTQAVGNPV